MTPRGWALVIVAVLAQAATLFYCGRLYERKLDPNKAKYEAAAGESKRLVEQDIAFMNENGKLRLELKESRDTVARLKKKSTDKERAVVVNGEVIILHDREEQSEQDSQVSELGLLTEDQARDLQKYKDNSLSVKSSTLGWRHLGVGWEARQWNSVEGWTEGKPSLAAGVNLWPFQFVARKVFDGSDKLQAEGAFNW